jgi:hypothetical protein
MSDKVAFEALIKEINIKSLVSGDKEARLILQFMPDDETLDGLNRLHRADSFVMAAIVPIENTVEQHNVIQKRSKRKSKGTAKGRGIEAL